MKIFFIPIIIIIITFLFITVPKVIAITGSSYFLGGTTYYNFSDGTSGSSYKIGDTTHYNFSDGMTGTSYKVGSTTYYNLTPPAALDASNDEKLKFDEYDSVKDVEIYSILNNLDNELCKIEAIKEYNNFKYAAKQISLIAVRQSEEAVEREKQEIEAILGEPLFSPYSFMLYYSMKTKNKISIANSGYKTSLNNYDIYNQYTDCLLNIQPIVTQPTTIIEGSQNISQQSVVSTEKNLSDKIEEVITRERAAINIINNNLSKRLGGRILLQVESRGEAWYVEPKTNKKHYMPNGQEAYNIMRDLGIGITNNDLNRVKKDNAFARRHVGKIFLQVEDLGQAHYIDFVGNVHYLKDGEAAYQIMRDLGLGITNDDLRKIDIGEL